MPSNNYIIHASELTLHDYEDLMIDALALSGDLFVTLATQLDEMSEDPKHYEAKTQELVQTLLYLQRNYKVSKQEPNYRQ